MGSGEGVSEAGRRKGEWESKKRQRKIGRGGSNTRQPLLGRAKCLGRSLNSKVCIAKLDLSNYS